MAPGPVPKAVKDVGNPGFQGYLKWNKGCVDAGGAVKEVGDQLVCEVPKDKPASPPGTAGAVASPPPASVNAAEYTEYAGEGSVGGVWTFYHKKPGTDDYIKQPLGGTAQKITKAEYDGVKSSLTFKKEKTDPKADLGKVEKTLPTTGTVIPFAPLATTTPEEIKKRSDLETALKAKGLDPKDEIKAYMSRFDEEPNAKKRMGQIEAATGWVKDPERSGDSIRTNIMWRARDKKVEKAKAANVSPLDTYNNLVAKGVVKDNPEVRSFLVENNDWKKVEANEKFKSKNWETVPAKGAELKKIAEDPLVAKADSKADLKSMEKETKRRVIVKEAHDRFVSHWTGELTNYYMKEAKPPLKKEEAEKKAKEEAEKRFNKISTNLGMTNADGSVRDDWDPDAPPAKDKKDIVGPARAFFPEEDIFEKDGTMKKSAKFNPGKVKNEKIDPKVKVEEMDDVSRAYYLPSSEERVASFRKKLIEDDHYSPAQADFIIDHLDPKGRSLKDCSTEEVRGYVDGFLSSPKETRDRMIIMLGQNKLAKDYAEKMGVSEAAARAHLASKGVLRRSATMEQIDFEEKRVKGLKAPPAGMSLEAARKDPQYKEWVAERDALFNETGADKAHKEGDKAKLEKIRAKLDPADLQYQDQLSTMDEQTKKQVMLKQVDQKNMLELEAVKQENMMKQIKARHENDKELEDKRHENQMELENMRQQYENARSFVKMAVDFIGNLLNVYERSVSADKNMLATITAANIRAGGARG